MVRGANVHGRGVNLRFTLVYHVTGILRDFCPFAGNLELNPVNFPQQARKSHNIT